MRTRISGAILSLFFPWANASLAQLPAIRLDGLFPSGAAPGTTVEVTASGANLDDIATIEFTSPGIIARPKMAEPGPFDPGPVPVPNTFIVTVPADVPVGMLEARIVGKYGVSNPRVFEIGDFPEVLEAEPNNDPGREQVVTIPCLLNGRMDSGGDQDRFRFQVAAGERILADCRARRIDSRMDAVLALFDDRGRLVAESRDAQQGDPLIDFVSPSGGTYTLRIADSLYGGGGEYGYRLQIGRLTHLDFLFPPAAAPGSNGTFTLYGRNLPGGQPAGLTIAGQPLEKLQVSIPIQTDPAVLPAGLRIDPEQSGLDLIEYRLRGPAGMSNSLFVAPAAAPVSLEAEPNSTPDRAQSLPIPCDLAGQFLPAQDDDWFRFEAKKGDHLWIEVVSQRQGARTDVSLHLRQETDRAKKEPSWAASVAAGQVQIFNVTVGEDGREVMNLTSQTNSDRREGGPEFDTRSNDPSYLFVAPADGTYRILVRSALASLEADPRSVYRLIVRPPQPDFRLAAIPVETSGEIHLRKGGREAIRVVAHRIDGFDGEIALTIEGLPAGVTCPGATIGPSASAASLVLDCADGAAPATGMIAIRGVAKAGGTDVVRPARLATLTVPRPNRGAGQQEPSYAARLTRSLAVCISPEPAPIALSLGNGQPIEISRAGQVKIPYAVTRRGNQGGLICFWDTIPPNFNQQQFNIDGGAANGELQYNLPVNMLPGTYSLSFSAQVQNVPYTRNPEAAKLAQDRKTAYEKVFTDQQAATKAAQDARGDTEQAATLAVQAHKQAQDAKTLSDEQLKEANVAVKVAEEGLAKARQAAAADTADANLAQAVANAEKTLAEAQAKARLAAETAAAAAKKLEEESVKLAAAEEAKVKANAALQAAELRLRQAQERKQQLEQQAQQRTQQSQPQNVSFFIPSTNVTLKVHPAPLTVTAPATVTCRQKGEQEMTIQIARLFGFNEGVNVSLVPPPSGVVGVQFPGGAIPGGQNEVKLKVVANPDALVGTHACQVRLQFGYNGQGMLVEQPLALTIEKGD